MMLRHDSDFPLVERLNPETPGSESLAICHLTEIALYKAIKADLPIITTAASNFLKNRNKSTPFCACIYSAPEEMVFRGNCWLLLSITVQTVL